MEDEEIHVLIDYHHTQVVTVFVERNEDRPAIIGKLTMPFAVYQRLGSPEAIDVCLRRVL